MNGLYGRNLAGPASFSGLGQTEEEMAKAELTIRKVIDGSMYKELNRLRQEQLEQSGRVDAIKAELDKKPASEEKVRSLELWAQAKAYNRSAFDRIQESIKKYNELAHEVRTYSLGTVTPPSLAGLGDLGLIQMALIPVILKACAWLAIGLAALVVASRADLSKADGIAAELRKTVGTIPETIKETSDLLKMTTIAAVVAVVGYVGLDWYSTWKKAKGVAT